MGTADKKEALEGKVASGLLNASRALLAAKLSKEVAVGAAIQQARDAVQDGYIPYLNDNNTGEGFINVMPNLVF